MIFGLYMLIFHRRRQSQRFLVSLSVAGHTFNTNDAKTWDIYTLGRVEVKCI